MEEEEEKEEGEGEQKIDKKVICDCVAVLLFYVLGPGNEHGEREKERKNQSPKDIIWSTIPLPCFLLLAWIFVLEAGQRS